MFIKNLTLKNIRSYSDLEVKFSEGSTLLSGDIGAGKTTILLAIEFALFGFIRGTISGSMLLRHGTKEGSVTLTFVIEGKEITIQRTLKKSSVGINQDAGYLIRDNAEKEELTAVELKSKILEILGYPEELLTKSKALIFRYTVYTPQEEMKKILYESSEDRLEKLRKLFDIDKYKRIKENASLYAKELRSEIKNSNWILDGIVELKETVEELKKQKTILEKETKDSEAKIKEAKENEELYKKRIEQISEQEKQLTQTKNQIRILETELKNLEQNKKRIVDETTKLLEEIEKNNKDKAPEIKETKTKEEISIEIKKYENMQKDTEEKLTTVKNKIAVSKSIIEKSKELISKIDSLENCPTCKQGVGTEHKEHVEKDEKKKIDEEQEKVEKYLVFLEKANSNIEKIKEKLESLKKEQNETELNSLKQKVHLQNLERTKLMKEKINQLSERKLEYDKEEQQKQEKLKEQQEILSKNKINEEELQKIKKDYEDATRNTRLLELKNAQSKQKLKDMQEEAQNIEKELKLKEEKKKQVENKRITENWMSKQFLNTIDTIEKNVLSSIHNQFNQRFQEWFNILIEDETISAGLNDTFGITMNQNGYETEIENLSGGEKTAVALAYRLALNKVINDFIGNIKTRDIIILDEPTDGFSTEQLDKVRDVLEALNCKQTIIVSHEPKMESFVQNIIKIRKHEHHSEVM